MRIGIVGAGPVGSILAAHLVQGGQDVFVVEPREDQRAALEAGGISVEGAATLHAAVAGAFADIGDLAAVRPDLVVVATKAYHLRRLLPDIARAAGPDAPVMSAQNGLDTEELIAAELPGRPVLRMVINYAGALLAPGTVRMNFFNPPNFAGCACRRARCGHAAEIAGILTATGLETRCAEDVKRHVWEKTILNASLSPICAVTGLTMAAATRLRTSCMVVESLLDECVRVAAKSGYDFGPGFFEACMAYLERGGPHKPSMLQDIEAGRETEIDFMNGRIAFYGSLAGVPTPLNDAFTRLIKVLEQRGAPSLAEVGAG